MSKTTPLREQCPHCKKQLPIEMIVDDMSGCPLAVKCPGPPGYLAAPDAWPREDDEDDGDGEDEPSPVPSGDLVLTP
jgi:hypothetical protein